MGQVEQNGSRSDQWSRFPLRLDCYLASFKPYLLLLLIHISLLLLNFLLLSFPSRKYMEAGCHIFLIYLVYRFFRFDMPNISLDISGISFPMSISLSEKPGTTITNALYLVFCTKNLV